MVRLESRLGPHAKGDDDDREPPCVDHLPDVCPWLGSPLGQTGRSGKAAHVETPPVHSASVRHPKPTGVARVRGAQERATILYSRALLVPALVGHRSVCACRRVSVHVVLLGIVLSPAGSIYFHFAIVGVDGSDEGSYDGNSRGPRGGVQTKELVVIPSLVIILSERVSCIA